MTQLEVQRYQLKFRTGGEAQTERDAAQVASGAVGTSLSENRIVQSSAGARNALIMMGAFTAVILLLSKFVTSLTLFFAANPECKERSLSVDFAAQAKADAAEAEEESIASADVVSQGVTSLDIQLQEEPDYHVLSGQMRQ